MCISLKTPTMTETEDPPQASFTHLLNKKIYKKINNPQKNALKGRKVYRSQSLWGSAARMM